MLKLIAVFVIAFLGQLLGHASGYVIGFRGGRPLLERPGRTLKLRLKTIDRGEKLFERFAWREALEAPGPVSGINTVPVPIGKTNVAAVSSVALSYVASSIITTAMRERCRISIWIVFVLTMVLLLQGRLWSENNVPSTANVNSACLEHMPSHMHWEAHRPDSSWAFKKSALRKGSCAQEHPAQNNMGRQ